MNDTRRVLLAGCQVAIANEARYAELDAAAGDGDFGGILARAARRVAEALDELGPETDERQLLLAAAHAVAGVGGTTGPLWGAGLLAAADAIGQGAAPAFRAAAQAVADLGGAVAGDRTMLDALLPAAGALESGADPAAAARRGAEDTSRLAARRGRASYVPGAGVGTVDAGAQAVADIVSAAVAQRSGEPPPTASGDIAGASIPPRRSASPGHVVGDPEQLVNDALAGLVAASGGSLRTNADPRFVARSDLPQPGLVGLVSGGGSGHEPMHAGLIGPGLLSAACPGEVFASPSAAQVAAAVAAADSGAGVLLIVKSYTGDVLNFRLGADLARSDGHEVEAVLVADDVALLSGTEPETGDDGVGRRGVAGTVIVEKMCGAAAEEGANLATLAALGRQVAARIRTIGVAVSGVTLPGGGDAAISLGLGEQEFGVGIHGEAGRERGQQQPADELVNRMCDALLNGDFVVPGDRVLLYTNGLGGLAGLELLAAHSHAVRYLQAAGVDIARSMAASLVTSLGMVGFSLSLARLDPQLTPYWDAPCSSVAWTVR